MKVQEICNIICKPQILTYEKLAESDYTAKFVNSRSKLK